MHEELIEFIEFTLFDGKISDKELKVILKKAKELGVDKDECEVLIDTCIQKKNQSTSIEKSKTETRKIDFKPKVVNPIMPADLNKQADFENNIKKINIQLSKLNKQELGEIKKIEDSNLELLNKKNSLKPELERLNKKINDEKKALASSINSEIKNKSKFKKIITVGTFPATLKKDSIKKSLLKFDKEKVIKESHRKIDKYAKRAGFFIFLWVISLFIPFKDFFGGVESSHVRIAIFVIAAIFTLILSWAQKTFKVDENSSKKYSNYIDELQVNFQPMLDSIIKDQQSADRIKQIINYNLSSINPTINK